MSSDCKFRLNMLYNPKSIAPTRLKGSQVARENLLRRRVASVKKNKKDGKKREYGPIFGLKTLRSPDSSCAIQHSYGGSSSDVITWKRIYGGGRKLINAVDCKVGCD